MTKRKKGAKLPKTSGDYLPIVRVSWLDASSHMGWVGEDQYKRILDHNVEVETLGFLVRKDRKNVVVIQTLSDSENTCGIGNVMKIPTGMVKKIHPLGKFLVKNFKTDKRSK